VLKLFAAKQKILSFGLHDKQFVRDFQSLDSGCEHSKCQMLAVMHLLSHRLNRTLRRSRFHMVNGSEPLSVTTTNL